MRTFLKIKDQYTGPDGPNFIRYSIMEFHTKKDALNAYKTFKKFINRDLKIIEIKIEKGNVFKKYKAPK